MPSIEQLSDARAALQCFRCRTSCLQLGASYTPNRGRTSKFLKFSKFQSELNRLRGEFIRNTIVIRCHAKWRFKSKLMMFRSSPLLSSIIIFVYTPIRLSSISHYYIITTFVINQFYTLPLFGFELLTFRYWWYIGLYALPLGHPRA